LQALVDQVAEGALPVTVGRVFDITEVVEAHRVMESNEARGKIVVTTG
jgi:NADPH:quinone reductase-like Zn-dependent oxidoreductase